MINIAHARVEKGLSQAGLAKLLGVSAASVSQWESGEKRPRKDNLERMSEVLGVSVDYLLGKQENPSHEVVEGVDKAIIGLVKALDSNQKRELLQYLVALIAKEEE